MDLKKLFSESERPLDNLVPDGGFCGIFRTIACIGDSLSSGEFESTKEDGSTGYNDMFDYSWGQYIARALGCKVYNFSQGGMSAKWYVEKFADERDLWNPDKAAQGYIIALGVNDTYQNNYDTCPMGSMDDIGTDRCTFARYYGQIIERYKQIQPDAKFFLMTMPRGEEGEQLAARRDAYAELLYQMAERYDNTYVLDFRRYAPVYDAEFKQRFFMGGHMNACGYVLTAQMVMSYIDYIVRHNMRDFKSVPFIGTGLKNKNI